MKRLSAICLFSISLLYLAGCDSNDGALEQAGERLDNLATDTGNAIEDACENVKEGLKANDQDC